MPEVLEDAGVYFNPEDSESIVDAIKQIIADQKLRKHISFKAKKLSQKYSWARCARETFSFIAKTEQK